MPHTAPYLMQRSYLTYGSLRVADRMLFTYAHVVHGRILQYSIWLAYTFLAMHGHCRETYQWKWVEDAPWNERSCSGREEGWRSNPLSLSMVSTIEPVERPGRSNLVYVFFVDAALALAPRSFFSGTSFFGR